MGLKLEWSKACVELTYMYRVSKCKASLYLDSNFEGYVKILPLPCIHACDCHVQINQVSKQSVIDCSVLLPRLVPMAGMNLQPPGH